MGSDSVFAECSQSVYLVCVITAYGIWVCFPISLCRKLMCNNKYWGNRPFVRCSEVLPLVIIALAGVAAVCNFLSQHGIGFFLVALALRFDLRFVFSPVFPFLAD